MTRKVNIQEYIGKPYEQRANGPDAYDCYSLAKAIAGERGFELPEQVSSDGIKLRLLMFDLKQSKWLEPLPLIEPWSLVLFFIAQQAHIVTMTDEPGKFIHVGEMTKTVRIDRIGQTLFTKPYGIYRPTCSLRLAAKRQA